MARDTVYPKPLAGPDLYRPDQNRKPHLKSLWQSVWEEITNKDHNLCQLKRYMCKCFNAYKHFSSQKTLLSVLVYGPCYCCEKF